MYELWLFRHVTDEHPALILRFDADTEHDALAVLNLLDQERDTGFARAAVYRVTGRHNRAFIKAYTLSKQVLGRQF